MAHSVPGVEPEWEPNQCLAEDLCPVWEARKEGDDGSSVKAESNGWKGDVAESASVDACKGERGQIGLEKAVRLR